MEMVALETLLLLMGASFVAGFIDAIAGGGGLITMPALLWAGLPPVNALATNKLQSTWGTLAATLNYRRNGHLRVRDMWQAVALTFAGSACGTLTVQLLDPGFLTNFIPFLLLGVAVYVLLQPRLGEVDSHHRMGVLAFSATFGFGIGFYDGFFGPGTGSFFALAFVTMLGFNLLKATAHAKLLNLTSNFASLVFFVLGGKMVWLVGLAMAVTGVAGGYLGSHLTIRHGARIVRPILVTVSVALTVRLIAANPDHFIRQWLGF